jgi:hypothetical protein
MSKTAEQLQASTLITPEVLSVVSEELWGDPLYGHAAEVVMAKQVPYAEYSVWRSGTDYRVSQYSVPLEHGPVAFASYDPLKPNIVARSASNYLRRYSMIPFALKIGDITEEHESLVERGLVLRLVPNVPTPAYLAPFIKRERWDVHRLRGTLGKAFDTLNAAAGVAIDSERTKEYDGATFIGRQEFEQKLKENMLSEDRLLHPSLSEKIARLASRQVDKAQPLKWGEVILEGTIQSERVGYVSWEKIALDSLGQMLQGGFRKNAERGPAILRATFFNA